MPKPNRPARPRRPHPGAEEAHRSQLPAAEPAPAPERSRKSARCAPKLRCARSGRAAACRDPTSRVRRRPRLPRPAARGAGKLPTAVRASSSRVFASAANRPRARSPRRDTDYAYPRVAAHRRARVDGHRHARRSLVRPALSVPQPPGRDERRERRHDQPERSVGGRAAPATRRRAAVPCRTANASTTPPTAIACSGGPASGSCTAIRARRWRSRSPGPRSHRTRIRDDVEERPRDAEATPRADRRAPTRANIRSAEML